MLNYIKETKGELKHVSWPSQSQVIMFTILVVIISIVVSVFLGAFDGIFKSLLENFIINN